MKRFYEMRDAQPFIFIRRGPSREMFQLFIDHGLSEFRFRIMPSIYVVNDSGKGTIHPLLSRMLTVTVKPIAMLAGQNDDTRYYSFAARLEQAIRYNGHLPDGAPTTWGLSFPTGSEVHINYDCEDQNGEIYRDYHQSVIPFPANLQCIRDREHGDYHVVCRR